MTYTVSEIAKELNVAPSTLRYYDKEGLLPFVERSPGGIRLFKDEDMSWLRIIECLKKTGMPIKDIKHFIDCCIVGDTAIDERLTIIENHRNDVIKQISEMQEMLNMLDYKCWYYETAKKAGTCSIHNTMKIDEVPEQYQKFSTPSIKK